MLKGMAKMLGVDITDADIELLESAKVLLSLLPHPQIKDIENGIEGNEAITVCFKPEDYPLSKLDNLAMILNDILPVNCEAAELELNEGKGTPKSPTVTNKYNALIFPKKPAEAKP